MDESLQELENELKRLVPRVPGVALRQSLERELGGAPADPVLPLETSRRTAPAARPWQWAAWSLAGVTAAAAAFVMVLDARRAEPPAMEVPAEVIAADSTPVAPQPEPAEAVNRYEPVHASTVLYDLQESAPTTLPDRTEGRQVRYRYVDTYTWRNPATNASLRWSVPRDEVRLVRTNLN